MDNGSKYFFITFVIAAVAIVGMVLFKTPMPGVADQGDFGRIMDPSGLVLPKSTDDELGFPRYFKYIITDYKIASTDARRNLDSEVQSTTVYYVDAICWLLTFLGSDQFSTRYLALTYIAMYLISLIIILNFVRRSSNLIYASVFALACFIIFLDGNYLVWFNSLYGEPTMITSLTLFIAAYLYIIQSRYLEQNRQKATYGILILLLSAAAFLGSKVQVITALPVVALLLWRILQECKVPAGRWAWLVWGGALIAVMVYPALLFVNNDASLMAKDNLYNSIFYGLLYDSPDPEQDLSDLGLNTDMVADAGKHAYQNHEEYRAYVPGSERTQRELYNKLSKFDVVMFYITHPRSLLRGLEYTASQCFFTGTYLGKYSYVDNPTSVHTFKRNTRWSDFRHGFLPRALYFITAIFAVTGVLSVILYARAKQKPVTRRTIELLWGLMLIAALQFPLPYVGNGHGDTPKQLFLFNFIFDIMLVVLVYWTLRGFFALGRVTVGKWLVALRHRQKNRKMSRRDDRGEFAGELSAGASVLYQID